MQIKFASQLQFATLFIINSKGYIIEEIFVSQMSELVYDVSLLDSGSYELIVVSNGIYSEAKTMIKE